MPITSVSCLDFLLLLSLFIPSHPNPIPTPPPPPSPLLSLSLFRCVWNSWGRSYIEVFVSRLPRLATPVSTIHSRIPLAGTAHLIPWTTIITYLTIPCLMSLDDSRIINPPAHYRSILVWCRLANRHLNPSIQYSAEVQALSLCMQS
ncbi:hypothetical protein DER46DRAFT_239137 [Fusarium sp. MPI-SDFR-AT-0072]|nr:hypothetical protein DER46DRAFT_239137 [Fusarium sp. MPI-SDFR-AT-0072]